MLSGKSQWSKCSNIRYKQQLFDNQLQLNNNAVNVRNYGMLIGRVLRGALKLRYLVLGSAVGGTVTLNKVRLLKMVMIEKNFNII